MKQGDKKREPLEIVAANLSLSIADLQMELNTVWDKTLGKLAGPSKLPAWAAQRREDAYQTFQRWPVSLGGSIPDDDYEEHMRNHQ